MNNIETKLNEVAARHGAALKSKSHSDRAIALEATKHTINTACDTEAAELKKSMTALEATRAAKLEAAAASVDTARRAHASALLGELFAVAPDSLPSLVARFRFEPSRADALAIRATWDRYNERAQVELGEPLITTVLGAMFVDDVIRTNPQLAGAINHLSGHQFGANDSALAALHAATKPNITPAELEDALTRLDSVLMGVALRHASAAPDPVHFARHALRRANATHRDLVGAVQVFDEEAGRAVQAKFAAEYKAPPSLSELFRQRLQERGLLSQ